MRRPRLLITTGLVFGVVVTAGAPADGLEEQEPRTTITAAPIGETFERAPLFRFVASPEQATRFQCRLAKAEWSPCRSPYRSSRLRPGSYAFRVRAIAGDAVERSPATADFEVVERTTVIGRSVTGRAIRATRLGDPAARRKVLLVGSIHGDETQGHRVIARLRDRYAGRLARVDLWTVMTVNPDGEAARSRTNAHGVDLNRNFSLRFDPTLDGGNESGPGPFSEPESRAVRDLAEAVRFDLAIWYHQPFGTTLVPCNETGTIARRYGRLSGLGASEHCGGPVPGSAISWQHHRFATAAFVVEFPGRPLRAAEVSRHAAAVATISTPGRAARSAPRRP